MDDSEIVELYLSRDESAISRTAAKYGARLRGVAYRILSDFSAVEECENDTYLTAWNQIPPSEPRNYLFAFLGKIIRCLAIDEVRKRNRRKRNVVLCELTKEMTECLPDDLENPEDVACARELGNLITSFLRNCSEEQRKVFVRRYWYFDSIETICKFYGFSKSKVKMILSRMRIELSAFLRKEGYPV